MTGHTPASPKGRPAILQAALFGLCPECGAPTLYDGVLRFAGHCRNCGLDFGRFNVGDGPAALLVMAVGALIVPAALAVHFGIHPPLFVHLLLWPLLATALTVGGLRLAKAGLLAAEHQREGREGRLDGSTGGPEA
jgi:uncharacterized protein (DUF983 family)